MNINLNVSFILYCVLVILIAAFNATIKIKARQEIRMVPVIQELEYLDAMFRSRPHLICQRQETRIIVLIHELFKSGIDLSPSNLSYLNALERDVRDKIIRDMRNENKYIPL